MKLASIMRPVVMLPVNEEYASDDARRVARIRELRVGVARRQWEELPAGRIERRDRWLVDAETDAVYQVYRGTLWERGSAKLIPDRTPALVFYLDGDGSPVVLERVGTWSAIAAKIAKRARR